MINKEQLESIEFMTYGQGEYIDNNEWFMFCLKTQNLYAWRVTDGTTQLVGRYTDFDLFKEAMYQLSAPHNKIYTI